MEKYKTIHENKVMINPPDELEIIIKKMNRLLQAGRNDERLNDKYRNLIKGKFCPDKLNEGKTTIFQPYVQPFCTIKSLPTPIFTNKNGTTKLFKRKYKS